MTRTLMEEAAVELEDQLQPGHNDIGSPRQVRAVAVYPPAMSELLANDQR